MQHFVSQSVLTALANLEICNKCHSCHRVLRCTNEEALCYVKEESETASNW